MRRAGFDPETFAVQRSNSLIWRSVLAELGASPARIVILADLGVSSMQPTIPIAVSPTRSRTARHADESVARRVGIAVDRASRRRRGWRGAESTPTSPDARVIVTRLKMEPIERTVELIGLPCRGSSASGTAGARDRTSTWPDPPDPPGVAHRANDELSSLDMLLRHLPQCLAPGGRVAFFSHLSLGRRPASEESPAGGLARRCVRPSGR